MESVFTGIDSIKERIKNRGTGESKFLKLEDGEKATIRFLQELDKSGRGYSDERGVALGVSEHVNPKDFSKSFRCTTQNGKCLGCELAVSNKKWRAKPRVLVNVLVRGGRGEPGQVKVVGFSVYKDGVINDLIAKGEEDTTIVDCDFLYKRTGTGFDTTYNLMPRAIAPLTKEESNLDLIDLDSLSNKIDYDEQVELVGNDAGSDDW